MNKVQIVNSLSDEKRNILTQKYLEMKKYYSSLNNFSILLRYALKSSCKEDLNSIIENGEFLAYDISEELLIQDKIVSSDQRKALINVLANHHAFCYIGVLKDCPLGFNSKPMPLYDEGLYPKLIKSKCYAIGDIVMVEQDIFFKGMDGTNKNNSLMFNIAKRPLIVSKVVSTHSNCFQNKYNFSETGVVIWHGYMIEGIFSLTTSHKSFARLPLI